VVLLANRRRFVEILEINVTIVTIVNITIVASICRQHLSPAFVASICRQHLSPSFVAINFLISIMVKHLISDTLILASYW
jgi:galactitol-specific phosphotransferase system IIC component